MEIHVGQRFKEAREKLGINQKVIADDLGVKQATVSQAEGQQMMSLKYIHYIVFKHNVSIEWLLLGKGNMIKNTFTDPAQIEGDAIKELSNEIAFYRKVLQEEHVKSHQKDLLIKELEEKLRSLNP